LNPDDFLKTHLFTEVAKSLEFSSNEKLLEEIGFGKYSIKQLMKRLIPKEKYDEIKAKEKDSAGSAKNEKIQYEGVAVRGVDDILIRFAQCCSPVPGDPIVGFISRGKGVTVHSEDCKNIKYLAYDSDRKIDVVWDTKKKNKHQVQIEVSTMNRPGMLGKISNAIAAKNINISEVMTVTGENGETLITFSIEVSDLEELELVILSIEDLEDVYKVDRVKGLHRLGKKIVRGKTTH
jgi:GTP pyrophosphokinase